MYRRSDGIKFSNSSLDQSFKGLTRGRVTGANSNFVHLGPVFGCDVRKFARPKSSQLVRVGRPMLDFDYSQTLLFP